MLQFVKLPELPFSLPACTRLSGLSAELTAVACGTIDIHHFYNTSKLQKQALDAKNFNYHTE